MEPQENQPGQIQGFNDLDIAKFTRLIVRTVEEIGLGPLRIVEDLDGNQAIILSDTEGQSSPWLGIKCFFTPNPIGDLAVNRAIEDLNRFGVSSKNIVSASGLSPAARESTRWKFNQNFAEFVLDMARALHELEKKLD